jgi:hypothetical protein
VNYFIELFMAGGNPAVRWTLTTSQSHETFQDMHQLSWKWF